MSDTVDAEIETDGGDIDLDTALSDTFDNITTEEDGASEQVSIAADQVIDDDNGNSTDDPVDNNEDGKTAEGDNADGKATEGDEATPPPGWVSEQRREIYASASPELRSQIKAREDEMEKGVDKLKTQFEEKGQVADAFREVVSPYMEQIAAEGGTPLGAVSLLLKTAHVLRVGTPEQKLAIIRNTARDFNVPLNQTEDSDFDDTDPQISALKGQVDQLTQQLQQREEREVSQGRQSMLTEIENFASATDTAGQPAYPHINTVFSDMLPIVAIIRQQNPGTAPADILKDAYERAVWANPDTRKLEQGRMEKSAESKRVSDAKKVATDAKKTTNVRPQGTRPGGPAAKSLDDALSEKYDQLATG